MDAKELLKFQIQRKIIGTSKSFLMILEDLIDDGYIIPEDKFNRLRKRTLDSSNEAIRELEAVIDKLKVTL